MHLQAAIPLRVEPLVGQSAAAHAPTDEVHRPRRTTDSVAGECVGDSAGDTATGRGVESGTVGTYQHALVVIVAVRSRRAVLIENAETANNRVL